MRTAEQVEAGYFVPLDTIALRRTGQVPLEGNGALVLPALPPPPAPTEELSLLLSAPNAGEEKPTAAGAFSLSSSQANLPPTPGAPSPSEPSPNGQQMIADWLVGGAQFFADGADELKLEELGLELSDDGADLDLPRSEIDAADMAAANGNEPLLGSSEPIPMDPIPVGKQGLVARR